MPEPFVPIIGTESELATAGSLPGGKFEALFFLINVLDVCQRNPLKTRRPIELGMFSNGHSFWGRNGCRLYPDVKRLEYATPECTTPFEALVHELAGPILINRLYRHTYRRPGRTKAWIIKNNLPPLLAADGFAPSPSYSNHQSVQILRSNMREFKDQVGEFSDAVGALYATLPLVCGAGQVFFPGDKTEAKLGGAGYTYWTSARAYDTTLAVNSGATGSNKPMFLARDDPLGDGLKYGRIQVACADANILPAANLIKLTVLQLFTEMWMAGAIKPIHLYDVVGAFRRTGRDFQAVHGWSTDRGEQKITTLEVQEEYLRQGWSYAKRQGRESYYEGLQEWEEQLAAFRSCDGVPRELIGRNDWVTKYFLVQKSQDFQQAQMRHLAYHTYQLGRDFDQSPAWRKIVRFASPRLLEAIEAAVTTPPATRAQLRSRIIAASQQPDKPAVSIDWQNYIVYADHKPSLRLKNPRLDEIDLVRADEFIGQMSNVLPLAS